MTRTDNWLYLHEEILLLALHDEKGTACMGSMHGYALGGAVVAELLARDRIRLDGSKKKRVEVADPTPIGDRFLDTRLERIANAKKPASLSTWVGRMANGKRLTKEAAERLCAMGVLREEERRVLGIFPRKVFPEVDPGPERELRARLEQAVTLDGAEVDDRTAMLVSIAHPAGILRAALGKKVVKAHKDRIRRISEGHAAGQATGAVIEAVQAAVVAAAVASSVVASSG